MSQGPQPTAAAPDVLAMREALEEILNLCAIGDVNEDTEAYGWGDAIKRARAALSAQGEAKPEPRADATEAARIALHEWAVSRWRDEVEHRPVVNIHRRTLDDTWRQVIRYAGGNPDAVLGPSHDELRAAMTENEFLAAKAVATPEPQEGRKPASIVLYNGDTDEPYIDIDGSDLWCNADDFPQERRWKIRWMVDAANRALNRRPHGITQDGERDHG